MFFISLKRIKALNNGIYALINWIIVQIIFKIFFVIFVNAHQLHWNFLPKAGIWISNKQIIILWFPYLRFYFNNLIILKHIEKLKVIKLKKNKRFCCKNKLNKHYTHSLNCKTLFNHNLNRYFLPWNTLSKW